MSYFRPDDFSNDFHNDFRRDDADFIINRLNDSMDALVRDYGEPFRLLADEINHDSRLAQSIAKNIGAMLYEVVIKGRNGLDQSINDIIDAVILQTGKNMMDKDNRLGNDNTYNFVCNSLDRNPFMQPARDDRDYRNNRNNGPRTNDRGSSSRYSQTTQQSRREGSSQPLSQGRLVSEKDRVKNEPARSERQEEQRNVPQLNNGDLVTALNRQESGVDFAPAYIVGDEQTIYMDGKLQVIDYTGTTPVDYEKHRVDLFFPNIIGASAQAATNSLTETAIRKAEEAMDLKITGYLQNPEAPDEPMTADSKLFQAVKSMSYQAKQTIFGLTLDTIDVRDSIISTHNGSHEWFRDNAMIVEVDQMVDFGDGNDALLNMQSISKTTNYADLVKWLINLSRFIDASRWKFLHDHLTRQLNIIMLRYARLGVTVSTFTGDWNELASFLENADQSKRTLMQSRFGKMIENLEIDRDVETGFNMIKVKHTLVYLPVASYECELASASVKTGVVTVAKDTKLYSLVSRLYENNVYGEMSFVTLDGLRFSLLMTEDITTRDFDIILF